MVPSVSPSRALAKPRLFLSDAKLPAGATAPVHDKMCWFLASLMQCHKTVTWQSHRLQMTMRHVRHLQSHAAGAFAVAKNKVHDRLIGDRRPRDAIEVAKLPYAPRLRRQKDRIAHDSFRDNRDCFYVFGADAERSHRQVIGSKLPRSWFRTVDEHTDTWHYLIFFLVLLSHLWIRTNFVNSLSRE